MPAWGLPTSTLQPGVPSEWNRPSVPLSKSSTTGVVQGPEVGVPVRVGVAVPVFVGVPVRVGEPVGGTRVLVKVRVGVGGVPVGVRVTVGVTVGVRVIVG